MHDKFIAENGNIPFSSVDLNDTIFLSDEENASIARMIKEKYVLSKHTRKIFFSEESGKWRTYVGNPRKEVKRKNREDLIEYLYKYYKAQEISCSTIGEVFGRSQKYRKTILNRSENTIERDRQVVERFFTKEFLSKPIIAVSDEEIADYVNRRSKQLHIKERALKDALQILNRIFDYAMRQECITRDNPASRIDLQNYYQNCDTSVKCADEKIFTEEEVKDIRKRIRMEMSEKEYDIIGYAMLFSIETGVRVAEIPPLRWSDISEKGIHIHRQQRMTRIKGKGRTFSELPYTKNERRHPKGGRYFPITDSLEQILQEVKAEQDELGISSEFIFCNRDGTWLNKETYSQRLRRMCRRIGLEITNNHAFRMSLNSNVFIPMGIPVTQRAYLLGHSVETNERFYSHMRTESLADIKDLLNGANPSGYAQVRSSIVGFPDKKIPQTLVK